MSESANSAVEGAAAPNGEVQAEEVRRAGVTVDISIALDLVTDVLSAARFVWTTEDELQTGVADALIAEGLLVEREVRVDARNRLDLKVGPVGIEVKIAGTWRDVRRQLERYAALGTLRGLVLVTSRPSHVRIGREVGGKPLAVHMAGSTL